MQRTIRRCPISESNIAITKSTHVYKKRDEEAGRKGEDLEPSKVILQFSIYHYAERGEDREEAPEDENPSPHWHFLLWYPVLEDEDCAIPFCKCELAHGEVETGSRGSHHFQEIRST